MIVSRFSVKAMRRDLDARYSEICRGGEEATVFLSRKQDAPVVGQRAGRGDERAGRNASGRSGLWDPIPITVPTYVSKPLAPRTVRTIDLSGPGVTSSGRLSLPVTADAPAKEDVVSAQDEPVRVEAADRGDKRDEDGELRAASA